VSEGSHSPPGDENLCERDDVACLLRMRMRMRMREEEEEEENEH
tara:strand:+ start:60 stop:191 length:132 start_codon:yes stop_codon:yes gene_type:complete